MHISRQPVLLCAVSIGLCLAPCVQAGSLSSEQLAALDETGSLSFSPNGGPTEQVTILRVTLPNGEVRYQKRVEFSGDQAPDFSFVSDPDPWVGYRIFVHNTAATPFEFDAFAIMPMLPITGTAGTAPQVFARVDVTLLDTGGAPGAVLEPLFFPNMFETSVQQTELGGMTDAGVGLGAAPITALGLTSLTSGPLAGPNPATDPTVDAWNYLTPSSMCAFRPATPSRSSECWRLPIRDNNCRIQTTSLPKCGP
jgi:hypothetical protein